ncbi:MAG: aKG-HExxH-type peptide beta-hydroxylase [Propylenella sp.]
MSSAMRRRLIGTRLIGFDTGTWAETGRGAARQARAGATLSSKIGKGATEPNNTFGFAPNAIRAVSIDARVRGRIADSLDAVLESANGIDLSRVDLSPVSLRIRTGHTRPQLFALYTEIVQAIHAGDEEKAGELLQLLAAPALFRPLSERVVTISDEHLGEGMAERYRRILDDDPSTPVALEPLPHETLAQGRALVLDALDLLKRASPELAGEIDALARQIVLAREAPGTEKFGGASTFYLWGAVFLNPAAHTDRLQMAEALIHEAAHMLLFGMGAGEPLVENPEEELYASPLRSDRRPMEGVVHAAYVLARIVAAMESIAALDDLSEAERASTNQSRRQRFAEYRDMLPTIRANARFTKVGEQAFASCVASLPG